MTNQKSLIFDSLHLSDAPQCLRPAEKHNQDARKWAAVIPHPRGLGSPIIGRQGMSASMQVILANRVIRTSWTNSIDFLTGSLRSETSHSAYSLSKYQLRAAQKLESRRKQKSHLDDSVEMMRRVRKPSSIANILNSRNSAFLLAGISGKPNAHAIRVLVRQSIRTESDHSRPNVTKQTPHDLSLLGIRDR